MGCKMDKTKNPKARAIEETIIKFFLPGKKIKRPPKTMLEPVKMRLIYELKPQEDQLASTTTYSKYSAFSLANQPAAIIRTALNNLKTKFIEVGIKKKLTQRSA
jgi:hypothetical protein